VGQLPSPRLSKWRLKLGLLVAAALALNTAASAATLQPTVRANVFFNRDHKTVSTITNGKNTPMRRIPVANLVAHTEALKIQMAFIFAATAQINSHNLACSTDGGTTWTASPSTLTLTYAILHY
jgi:hypothetical protein